MRHRTRAGHAGNLNPVPVPPPRIFGCKSRSERLLWGMQRAYAPRLLTLVFRGETGVASASGTACNLLRRGPAAFLFEDGARLMPKKAYPFQLVPVIALATAESDL